MRFGEPPGPVTPSQCPRNGSGQLAQAGISLYQIITLLGNSPGICQGHYAALVSDAMTETVEFHPISQAPRPTESRQSPTAS